MSAHYGPQQQGEQRRGSELGAGPRRETHLALQRAKSAFLGDGSAPHQKREAKPQHPPKVQEREEATFPLTRVVFHSADHHHQQVQKKHASSQEQTDVMQVKLLPEQRAQRSSRPCVGGSSRPGSKTQPGGERERS